MSDGDARAIGIEEASRERGRVETETEMVASLDS